VKIEDYLAENRGIVDRSLDNALPDNDVEPGELHRAMRYSVFAGGKRIRPIMAIAACEAVGGTSEYVQPFTVALECVHTYSLIHDDLPAMDDDDLRRGKPSSHKMFGEAVAILAGDALLAFAFEVLSDPLNFDKYDSRALFRVIHDLSAAAGSRNLVAGQCLDILNEGKTFDIATVYKIMEAKTAALIRASLTGGGRLAGGSDREIGALADFGKALGLVFQMRDDLLDLEGDPQKLGKAVKKDLVRGKATLPAILGPDKTRDRIRDLINSAIDVINDNFGDKGELLVQMAGYIGNRVI
jgi:geranylgeranyl diphosphate synthase, type II